MKILADSAASRQIAGVPGNVPDGAVSGTQRGHLTGLLEDTQPDVAGPNVRPVRRQIVVHSPVLRELLDSGQFGLVGGFHDLNSGKVQFFHR